MILFWLWGGGGGGGGGDVKEEWDRLRRDVAVGNILSFFHELTGKLLVPYTISFNQVCNEQ